jgi:hypothetical protein
VPDQQTDEWRVVAVTDADGTEWRRRNYDEWHAEDGRRYPSRHALADDHSTLQVSAVENVDALVRENDELADGNWRLSKQLVVAEKRLAAYRVAAQWATKALAGLPRRCVRHGADLVDGQVCCRLPRWVTEALGALDTAAHGDPEWLPRPDPAPVDLARQERADAA